MLTHLWSCHFFTRVVFVADRDRDHQILRRHDTMSVRPPAPAAAGRLAKYGRTRPRNVGEILCPSSKSVLSSS